MRPKLEYYSAAVLLKSLTFLPRSLAKIFAYGMAVFGYLLAGRLRRVAYLNLQMAMPHTSARERRRIVLGVFMNLARLLVEFSQFPKITRENIRDYVHLEGFENYAKAQAAGKGVVFITGHFGAWELAPFASALLGFPLMFVVRPIDNSRVDQLVMSYRLRSGNVGVEKKDAMISLARRLHENGIVGILIDQNASREEGVFVDFLGIPASTTTGVARLAMRMGSAVLPGFLVWDRKLGKHRLCVGTPIPMDNTGNREADIEINTRRINQVLEERVRQHPDQWLWVHRRWKTRPVGDPELYP